MFKNTLEIGSIGEQKFMWLVENTDICWFRPGGKNIKCEDKPTLIDVTKAKEWQDADDVDFLMEGGDCSWCSDEKCKSYQLQRHEVKTNLRTHEGYNPTQNIIIETESDSKLYRTGEKWPPVLDPLTGKEVEIRKGVGFWNKTERKADWYHFFNRINDGTKTPISKIEAFENDNEIPAGAGIITKWPIDYILSVRGRYLQTIISSNEYEEMPIRRGKGKGYMIPVTDLLAGKKLNIDGSVKRGTDLETGKYAHDTKVMVNFILDEDQVYIKGCGSKYTELYCPVELFEAMGGYDVGSLNEVRIKDTALRDLEYMKHEIYKEQGLYLDLDLNNVQLVTRGAVPSFYSKYRKMMTEYPDFQIEFVLQHMKPY